MKKKKKQGATTTTTPTTTTTTTSRRPMKKRPEGVNDGYNLSDHGESTSGSFSRLVVQGCNVDLVWPKWKDCKGPVAVRPLPCFDVAVPDEDVFMHTRTGCGTRDYSDWIRGMPVARNVGTCEFKQRPTFILYNPVAMRRGEYDLDTNPYLVMKRSILGALRLWSKKNERIFLGKRELNPAEWTKFASRDMAQENFAFRDQQHYFIQCITYATGDGKNLGSAPRGLGDADRPQILVAGKQIGDGILAQLRLQREDWSGDEDDFERFVHPNPVSIGPEGEWLLIYRKNDPSSHPPAGLLDEGVAQVLSTEEEEEDEIGTRGDGGGGGGTKDDQDRYLARFCQKWTYTTSDGRKLKSKRDLTMAEDVIRERLMWWPQVLNVPSNEEQAVWLAQAFRTTPDFILYGWRDTDLITDEIRGILAARTAIPGAEDEIPSDDPPPRRSKSDSRRQAASIPDDDEDADDSAIDADYGDDEEEETPPKVIAPKIGPAGLTGKKKKKKIKRKLG